MSEKQKISEKDLGLVVGGVGVNSGGFRTGVVESFDDQKGYGFITPDDGGEIVFVHFLDIEGPGFRTLNAGDRVQFQVTRDHKGIHAIHVSKI